MSSAAERKDQVWRVIDMIKWGEEYFKSKGLENPKREIEWLLCDLLNYKRIDLYVQFEETISRTDLDKLRGWIKRRVSHEPLQYITGHTEFYGYPFNVSADVLIPRPETERLVDVALNTIKNISKAKVFEVGSGSGCIAVSIGAEKPDASIFSIDVSEEAIKMAQKNAILNKIENVEFVSMDFFKEQPKGTFDLFVSNPPYIPKNEVKGTMSEVHQYEPEIALTDQEDGLKFYHRIAESIPGLVNLNGWVVMEVGLGEHPNKALEIFKSAGFNKCELVQDFNGDDRVLKIQI
jgi:release factor glutamine methyltransferase